MAKDKVFYWNDDTMSFSYKGKDYVAGDPIPEDYKKEQPKKFQGFVDNQQISDKAKVKFEEKKQRELEDSKKAVDKLRVRNSELVSQKSELQEKVDSFKASMKDLEKLDLINDELDELKEEKKLWADSKAESQKKIGSFSTKLEEAFAKSSISKDDKKSLLSELGELQKDDE